MITTLPKKHHSIRMATEEDDDYIPDRSTALILKVIPILISN